MQQINNTSAQRQQVYSGLNTMNMNQQRQITKQQRPLDTQTVLQLIYQQQQLNEQVNNSNSTASQQAQAAARYKTELCRSFQENGICKYSDKCQFAHGAYELRNMSRHPKYKTELCRTFHAAGYCPYGPRCHFVHDTQIDANTRTAKPVTSPKQLSLKLNNLSSASSFSGSSSSSSSGSTSPLSLNQFQFDFNNDLESLLPQNNFNQASNSLLMYANEFDFSGKSVRKQSTSSMSSASSGIESMFYSGCSSSTSGSLSPKSNRSISPDFMSNTNTQSAGRKFYDDWDYSSTDSIVNQILSNIVCLDNNSANNTQTILNENDINDLTLNYLSLATSNLLI